MLIHYKRVRSTHIDARVPMMILGHNPEEWMYTMERQIDQTKLHDGTKWWLSQLIDRLPHNCWSQTVSKDEGKVWTPEWPGYSTNVILKVNKRWKKFHLTITRQGIWLMSHISITPRVRKNPTLTSGDAVMEEVAITRREIWTPLVRNYSFKTLGGQVMEEVVSSHHKK